MSILIVWRGAQSKEIDPINYKKEIDENAVGIPPRSRVSQHELKKLALGGVSLISSLFPFDFFAGSVKPRVERV